MLLFLSLYQLSNQREDNNISIAPLRGRLVVGSRGRHHQVSFTPPTRVEVHLSP
jgi:hypothetical protein